MPTGVRAHVPRVPVDTIAETDTDRTAANPAIPDICLRTSEQTESLRVPLARRRENPRTAGCLCERISLPPRRNHPLRPDAGRVDATARDSFNRLLGDPGRCPPVPLRSTQHMMKRRPPRIDPVHCTWGPQSCVRVKSLPLRERPHRPLRVVATGIQFYRIPQNHWQSTFLRTDQDSRPGHPDSQDQNLTNHPFGQLREMRISA